MIIFGGSSDKISLPPEQRPQSQVPLDGGGQGGDVLAEAGLQRAQVRDRRGPQTHGQLGWAPQVHRAPQVGSFPGDVTW